MTSMERDAPPTVAQFQADVAAKRIHCLGSTTMYDLTVTIR